MRTYLLTASAIVLFGLAACKGQEQAPPQAQQPQPLYTTTATIKDLMDSVVDPGSDYIWDSVETIVSAKGVEEKYPRTDEEWKQVRRHAIMLLEATNLLQMPGRHVAKPGEKADDLKVELAPEKIEDMINKRSCKLQQVCHRTSRRHPRSLWRDRGERQRSAFERGRRHRQRVRKMPFAILVSGRKRPEGAHQREERQLEGTAEGSSSISVAHLGELRLRLSPSRTPAQSRVTFVSRKTSGQSCYPDGRGPHVLQDERGQAGHPGIRCRNHRWQPRECLREAARKLSANARLHSTRNRSTSTVRTRRGGRSPRRPDRSDQEQRYISA